MPCARSGCLSRAGRRLRSSAAVIGPQRRAAAEPSPAQIEAADRQEVGAARAGHRAVQQGPREAQGQPEEVRRRCRRRSSRCRCRPTWRWTGSARWPRSSTRSGRAPTSTRCCSAGSTGELGDQLAMLDLLARSEKAAGRRRAEGPRQVRRREAQARRADRRAAQAGHRAGGAEEGRSTPRSRSWRSRCRRRSCGSTGCPTGHHGARRRRRPPSRRRARRSASRTCGAPTGPNSFDCSGLTQYAWKAAGVSLTHHTGDQWGEGRRGQHTARPVTWCSSTATCSHVGSTSAAARWCTPRGPASPCRCRAPAPMPIAGYRRVI